MHVFHVCTNLQDVCVCVCVCVCERERERVFLAELYIAQHITQMLSPIQHMQVLGGSGFASSNLLLPMYNIPVWPRRTRRTCSPAY